MSSGNERNESKSPGRNPFDSDYSASEVSKQSRGVSFDLDAIAATRRAMLSGKAPENSESKYGNSKNGKPKTHTADAHRKGKAMVPRLMDSDVEAGDGRVIRETVRTQKTAEGSFDSAERNSLRRPRRDDDSSYHSGNSNASESDDSDSDSDSDDSSFDSVDGQKKRRKSYVFAVVGVVSVMMLAGIIALSVLVFGGKKGNKSTMPILTARQEGLHNIIESVADPQLLKNTGSPQYKAHKWLLYEDSLGLAPANGASRDRIIQRYTLAVFYFATGGPTNWTTNSWMDSDECDKPWTGIGCTSDGVVHVLSLNNQGLSGTVPKEISQLTFLEHLILKNNEKLVGSIPTTIGDLTALRQLGIYNNNLDSTIPDELFKATSLKFINLQNNDLSGTISTGIGALERLETFVLMNNKFKGVIPLRALASTKIKFLGLSHNNFSGKVDPAIGDLGQLEYLYLDGNSFEGELPSTLSMLTNLKSVNLDENDFSGPIPTVFGHMKQLEFLSMQTNGFNGQVPSEFGLMTALSNMNLAQNALTGTIPDLSPLTDLNNLLLYYNKLTGSLPDHLFNLTNLEILFLSSNQLSSTVPTEISNLKDRLRGLYLSDNQFIGELPASLCELKQLEALLLDENNFQGTIPSCFGSLQQLRQLYVFQNKLSGDLPTQLTQLSWLTGLGIEENSFSGSVPVGICTLKNNTDSFDLWADCGGNSPDLLCPCCTVCCPSEACV